MASRQARIRFSSNWSMPTINRLIKNWCGSPFLSGGNDTTASISSTIPTREDLRMLTKEKLLPQYLGSGDPALKNYCPGWLDNMADDATVEGSMLNGAVEGADAVRSVG